MNELNIFDSSIVKIDLNDFIYSIIISAILSVLVQLFYMKYGKSFSEKFNFSKNFVILGITITIVITVVKSSLALSLGLVGALSIVRFRAAIKDPEELVYLFLIISIGLASGANQYKIAIFGTLIALLILFIYHSFSKKTKVSNTKEFFNFSIVSEKKLNKSELIKLISPYCDMVDFVSITENNSRSILNLRIRVKSFSNIEKLTNSIRKKFSNTELIISEISNLSL